LKIRFHGIKEILLGNENYPKPLAYLLRVKNASSNNGRLSQKSKNEENFRVMLEENAISNAINVLIKEIASSQGL